MAVKNEHEACICASPSQLSALLDVHELQIDVNN